MNYLIHLFSSTLFYIMMTLATFNSIMTLAQDTKNEKLWHLSGSLTVAQGNKIVLPSVIGSPLKIAKVLFFFDKTPSEGEILQSKYEKLFARLISKNKSCPIKTLLECTAPERKAYGDFFEQNPHCRFQRADDKNITLALSAGTTLEFSSGYDNDDNQTKRVKATAKDGRSMDLKFYCSKGNSMHDLKKINDAFTKYGLTGALESNPPSAVIGADGAIKPANGSPK